MNHSARFWDRIAASYAKRPVADETVYRKKLQLTQECFRPGMQVLEFGCGTGSTALIHAPYVKHIHAIDISSKMIDIARNKARETGTENVKFEQSTLDRLRAADGSFDVILGLNILHLLDDWEEAVARVYRLLKPGGIFIASTACLGDNMKFIRFIAPLGRFLGLMPLVKVFTMQELEGALSTAGFILDHRWQPGRNKAVFTMAKKPA